MNSFCFVYYVLSYFSNRKVLNMCIKLGKCYIHMAAYEFEHYIVSLFKKENPHGISKHYFNTKLLRQTANGLIKHIHRISWNIILEGTVELYLIFFYTVVVFTKIGPVLYWCGGINYWVHSYRLIWFISSYTYVYFMRPFFHLI